MCGIIGYIGNAPTRSILLNCLRRLEYRGYDSCGIAVAASSLKVYKDAVRVEQLAKVAPRLRGTAGIGHTRWATHGEPSWVNAHPHLDCSGRIAVVHNGVINNFQQLKRELMAEGHNFVSETDSEVISHLIEKYYNGNLVETVETALRDIDGSYAIMVLVAGESRLVAARKDSPLIIGVSDRENFIASDVPAILDYTDRVIYLEEGDIGIVTRESIKIRRAGAEVAGEEHKVLWRSEDAQKAGYDHFMLKEIHEQPKVIRNTIGEYLSMAESEARPVVMDEANLEGLLMVACGTSYHAALVGKCVVEELVGVPVRAELAGEFAYSHQVPAATTAMVITQSGETADALKAVKRLKGAGCRVVAITNVVGSTASRLADQTVYTRAGPEISVAATKSFIAELMSLYWLALSYSRAGIKKVESLTMELRQLPQKVQQVLDKEGTIAEYARYLSACEGVFFIGRGINFPVALEGALKLKEIAYIHAEGYSAGELKHGPFALLGASTPVIAIVAKDSTYEAMLANVKEVKARGAPVIALAEEGDEAISELADSVISLPSVDVIFSPVVNTVALQLLAYYTARERGCPIDFPRNLAKSVTVE